jgi:hypothetical protein
MRVVNAWTKQERPVPVVQGKEAINEQLQLLLSYTLYVSQRALSYLLKLFARTKPNTAPQTNTDAHVTVNIPRDRATFSPRIVPHLHLLTGVADSTFGALTA